MTPNTVTDAMASNKKNHDHPMASAVDQNVDAIIVAATRFKKPAILIALPRMQLSKTSEGNSHAPGPIPMLKNARYRLSPNMVKPVLSLELPKNEKLTISSATAIPNKEVNKRGRLPYRSNSFPPTTTNLSLSKPKNTNTKLCFSRVSIPDWAMTSIK